MFRAAVAAVGLCLTYACFHAVPYPEIVRLERKTEVLRQHRQHHHRQHHRPWFNGDLSPSERAKRLVAAMRLDEIVQQLGTNAPAIPRLGIGAYHWRSNAIHGLSDNGVATVFPQVRIVAFEKRGVE